MDVVEEDIDANLHEVIIIYPIFFTDGYNIETSFQINTIVFELWKILHAASNNSQRSSDI